MHWSTVSLVTEAQSRSSMCFLSALPMYFELDASKYSTLSECASPASHDPLSVMSHSTLRVPCACYSLAAHSQVDCSSAALMWQKGEGEGKGEGGNEDGGEEGGKRGGGKGQGASDINLGLMPVPEVALHSVEWSCW